MWSRFAMSGSKEIRVLGFFKEEGDERFTAELKGDMESSYVEIPSGIRNRLEIVVGNILRVFLDSVVDKNGKVLKEINKEVKCEIIGYWNELHIPQKVVYELNLKKGDILNLVLKSIIQFGEEKSLGNNKKIR
jgi:hypothetical protein